MLLDLGCLCIVILLVGTGIAQETASDSPANETKLCETRTCSKLEYYDKLKQKCRDFPGGGFLVIMDHSTKCAHGDSGLHTFSRRDFYYVCHPEGVMIGLCPDDTVFSDTEKRCIMKSMNQSSTIKVHDESQNCNIIVPDCSAVGLFPIPSNCSFYFKCQEHNYNFHQYVYQCPRGTFFHPDLQKCSSSNKCYEAHEDILHNFSKDYFPECHIYGQFRTAKDCTLYYRCVPNIDGSFYQIRYECPYKMYYHIEKESCVPEHYQCCDYIPYERIIEDYKRQHEVTCSTLDPQPTTAISAINTKITSSYPAYYDSTKPFDMNDAQSLVSDFSVEVIYSSSETTPTYVKSEPNCYMPNDPLYEVDETSNTNVDNYGDVTESNIYDVNYGEDVVTTDPVLYYSNSPEMYYAESSTLETESMDDTYPEGTDPSAYATGYDITTAPTYETSSEVSKYKSRPKGYDDIEWDESAWDAPGRRTTKSSLTTPAPAQNCFDTGAPVEDAYGTPNYSGCPDHYSMESTADEGISTQYAEPYKELECDSLTYTTRAYEPDEPKNMTESPDTDIVSGCNCEQGNSTELGYEDGACTCQYGALMDTEREVAINCTTDKDGEFVCNGQKLSQHGYMELLGYVFRFNKWLELPNDHSNKPKLTLNFHFTIEYPFNYEFKAHAIEYSTRSVEPLEDTVDGAY